MTLGEILVSVLIFALVSTGLMTGVVVSNNQLSKEVRISEANEPYTTLSSLLTNELRYTKQIKLNNGKVDSFFSVTYAIQDNLASLIVLDDDSAVITNNDFGELAIGSYTNYNRLVGSATYGEFDLGARASITYLNGVFTVQLDIGVKYTNDDPIISESLDVRAMNLKVDDITSLTSKIVYH